MSTTTRVAIVTGASQGIGEALVAGYRKLGYAVVANSRTIAESGDPMVLTVAGDVARPGVGQRLVDAAVAEFGRVDTDLVGAVRVHPDQFHVVAAEDGVQRSAADVAGGPLYHLQRTVGCGHAHSSAKTATSGRSAPPRGYRPSFPPSAMRADLVCIQRSIALEFG